MASLIGTLYPPVIDTFMPAFVYTNAVRVYYSLPAYSDVNNITYLHITLTDQETNQNALANNAGIYIIKNPLQFYDKEKQQYYIDIVPSLTSLGTFKCNQFYKVQLRFDCNVDSMVPTGKNVTAFAVNRYVMDIDNQVYFSEWSTVCLIRPIYEPKLEITNFSDSLENELTPNINRGILPISGRLWFRNEDDDLDTKEQLYSYQISILDEYDNELLSTDLLYTSHEFNNNNINTILNLMNSNFDNQLSRTLYLKIQYTTGNLYTNTVKLKFYLIPYLENVSPFFENPENVFRYILDNENGYVNLISSFVNENNIDPEENALIYIMRTSSEDGFNDWQIMYSDEFSKFAETYAFEDISVLLSEASTSISATDRTIENATYSELNGLKNYQIADNTVQSMTWYKYCVQFLIPTTDNNYSLTRPYYYTLDGEKESVLPQFYDILLMRDGIQVPLRLNANISSYKKNVSRTKLDTLGGKYPKFAENAIMNYRQYTLSGTISAEMDSMKTFMKKSEFFTKEEIQNLYMEFLKEKNAPSLDLTNFTVDSIGYEHCEWLWERVFREKLYDWLNDGEPKLMRSLPEGNVVVMLSDISLTPNSQLSRLVADFTCTAYEVGEGNTFDQLRELGILGFAANNYSLNATVQKDTSLMYIDQDVILQNLFPDYKNGTVNAFVANARYNINQHEGISLNDLDFVDIFKDKFTLDKGLGLEGLEKDREVENFYISNVKILFNSTNQTTFYLKDGIWYTSNENLDNPVSAIGHLIIVNNDIQIFTNQNEYEIPQDFNVTSLKILDEDSNIPMIQMDCVAHFSYDAVKEERVIRLVENIIAQYNQVFIPGEWLDRKIKLEKTKIDSMANTKEYLNFWNGISVETLNTYPYSLFAIKNKNDTINKNYLVSNENGICNLSELPNVKDIAYIGKLILPNEVSYSDLSEDYGHDVSEIDEYIIDKIQHWLVAAGEDTTFEMVYGVDNVNLDNIIDYFQNKSQYTIDEGNTYDFQWSNIYENTESDTPNWIEGDIVNIDIYMNSSNYNQSSSSVPTYWKKVPYFNIEIEENSRMIFLNPSTFVVTTENTQNNTIYNINGNPYIFMNDTFYPVVLLTRNNIAITLSDLMSIENNWQDVIDKIVLCQFEENGYVNYYGQIVKEKKNK